MNKYKIDKILYLDNLSGDENKRLMDLLQKASKPKEWWKDTEFDINKNDLYYYISFNGDVGSNVHAEWNSDIEAINFGNACTDKNYMKQRANDIKCFNYIANFAKTVNGNWEADWSNGDSKKYYVYRSYGSNQGWNVGYDYIVQYPNVVYFKSAKDAKRCIDEVLIPLEEGKL